jgi:hypothetical protein
MQRLLLQQIVNMGDDRILLDLSKVWVPTLDGKVVNTSHGTKWLYSTPEVLEMAEHSGRNKRPKNT